MKKLIVFIFVGWFAVSCITTGPNSSTSSTQRPEVSSPEAQARSLTNRMRNELSLDKIQEDRVLSINIAYQKLLQSFNSSKEQDKVNASKESYHKSLVDVLTSEQFSKFLVSFPDL